MLVGSLCSIENERRASRRVYDNPFQYDAQLQDEERRRDARVDSPGVDTSQHHRLEHHAAGMMAHFDVVR
jgi:hypothetical protein